MFAYPTVRIYVRNDSISAIMSCSTARELKIDYVDSDDLTCRNIDGVNICDNRYMSGQCDSSSTAGVKSYGWVWNFC